MCATKNKYPNFFKNRQNVRSRRVAPSVSSLAHPPNITQSSRPKLILQCSQENRRFFLDLQRPVVSSHRVIKHDCRPRQFQDSPMVSSCAKQLLQLIIVPFCLFGKRASIRSWFSRITALFQAQDSDMFQNLLTVGASATLNTATFFFFSFFHTLSPQR